MDRPTFIVIAGVNGAGKTTLYTDNHELFANTHRINADEILQNQNGDWHNNTDNLRSMREELREIHDALAQGTSIHMETTLAGNGYALKKIITEAHANNYEVSLLYVTVSSPQVAIQRVKSRVAKGGHGIPEDLILKRYQQSLANLPTFSKLVDNVKLYLNNQTFQLVYLRQNQIVSLDHLVLAPWLPQAQTLLP
ncbi:zeta toxin family protein [Levilactobacillus fujinensis]|uniref:UDP-N-acetylglucosamine kinase n=1 Tax=Levilactobacillus fujinensis TaxID=2486024 RepID=A0ABW1TG40_9LACO|nr:zeta toxin family protein [Levilactobacillus fujinensis]